MLPILVVIVVGVNDDVQDTVTTQNRTTAAYRCYRYSEMTIDIAMGPDKVNHVL